MSEDEKLLKEAKKLPWEDRLTHKNWKVRNDANIDLAAVCDSISDPKDPRLREFGPFFKKLVADSNAPVQEKALDALIAFLRAADADAGRYGKEVCDAIVAKCLTGKPKTVEKAQAAFMLWVELEAVDAFLDAMEKAIKNKVSKAVVPAIDVMFQALSEFGTKIVTPKRLLKMLPDLFEHQDQNVRASSKGLTLELCRWIGKEPVKSILFENMRDTMKKELEAELANATGTAKRTRKIRSEQDKEPEVETASEVVGTGPAEGTVDDIPLEIDEYELVDPVEILTSLDKSGFWEGVKAAKWSDRKDAVAELTKLASTKRIAPGDFSEVCRTLKKIITDVNIAVAVEAIQALGNLSRGLRANFSSNSRVLLPILLEKLKEKKPTLLEALTQTLQAMHQSGCLNLMDIVEDVKTTVKNKVPQVRSLTLNWVTYCIETSNRASILKVHKEYVPICMECLNDGTPEVRDAAFSALASIAKMVGMRPLEKSLEKLDDVRKKKLSEMIGGSTVDPSIVPSSAANPSSGKSLSSTEVSDGSFVKRSAASMLSGKKPIHTVPVIKKFVSSKSVSTKKGDGGGQSKVSKPAEPEDLEPAEMSLEEIENRLGSLVQSDTISQLKSAVWKERLEGSGPKSGILAKLIANREQGTLPSNTETNPREQVKAVELRSGRAFESNEERTKHDILANDGTPEVRDAAFSALASIAKMVGMRPLEKSLEKLDDVRKNKLSEMIGGSTVDPSIVPSSAANPSSGKSLSSTEVSDGSFVKRSAASMLSGKKPIHTVPVIKKFVSSKSVSTKKGDGGGQSKVSKPAEPEDLEPAEMSLEEIENRLGSLVQSDTISQLKSAVWKERLEAIVSFKEQVEALTNLDPSVEFLIRLLCVVPGWNEKNVQVQQQIVYIITHIASTASKFPKKCVVLCLIGVSERVADIKTRALAMKCLTTFCEAAGPGFVFERLYKIIKEHKNPKVMSEGLLWLVSAVEDFGISYIKLKDLVDFCKDIGLQSSAAATRNATIKLIGVLHKFVGPDIKGFLSDVKPALLSALDAECEKNPYEGTSAVPKKTVKVTDATSSLASGGVDGLPREDISEKITLTLLKGLECSDWKIRLESIESVNKIVEEADRRIQPNGTGELFGALRSRLHDSNKNLIMTTLSTIGALASAMGQAIDKSSKGILSDILKCLGDNKKQMRECTLSTLDAWLAAVHLDKMVPFVSAALTDTKLGAEGRKDLFDWLSRQLGGSTNFPDAIHLLKPAASSMTDKSADVRKAAETLFNEILRVCGQEMVTKNLRDIQGSVLAIVNERLKPHGASQVSFEPGWTVPFGSTSKNSLKIGKANAYGDRASQHGNKAAPTRTISTKGSRQELVTSVQDINLQSQTLLIVKDSNKDYRERMVVRRFKFEELRLEQIQDLENDLIKYFREDLHRLLLCADFKKQVDGIEMLHKALPSIKMEVIEVLDVLLKWFVMRFCESNTSCLLKVLEFLHELLDMLKNVGYTMTEAETAIFLPCLVEKSGHNIEKVREKMRELMKQIIHTYSATKTFPYVLEGLRSRNNRTRIESADLFGFLLDNYGAEISGQLKSLQIVASLTAERDGDARKAALNTLATGYKILGEDIWRYVGKLTEAQRSMLDDRFKWKAREMEKRKEGRPGEARAALRRSVRDNGSDLAEQSGEVTRSVAVPIFSRESYGHLEVQADKLPIHQTYSCMGPTDWNEALDIVAYGSPEQSVEGMKVVCHELGQVTADPEGSSMGDIMKDVDRLVLCLAKKIMKTFDFSLNGASSRSCKYVLNTLMPIFQNRTLAHAVKESTLDSLITELLLRLLDERVPQMDDGSQLLKALNILMLKILDNADRTSSFVVLINLLLPLDPSRWPSPAANESLVIRNQKFSDLVVKCLIKLTKVLQSTIYVIDLDRILQSIHICLQKLGMDEIWKSIIYILSHSYYSLPYEFSLCCTCIVAYVFTIFQYNFLMCVQHQELAAIFKKIGDKQTSSIGLYELYRITQLYPQVDIFAQLQNASDAFRTYIRDGLAQMERNAAAGRTPSSVPLSTPPPVMLNPSPRFGALSPVTTDSLSDSMNTNTRIDPTNFTLPPSYAEDDRSVNTISPRGSTSDQSGFQHLDESRTDILPSVTNGTLDAIRERMKSIQLAAAQVNPEPRNRPLVQVNGNVSHPYGAEGQSASNSTQSGILPMDEKALSSLQARMERLKSGSFDFM
ncbi:LOW QUALITY PROTEIN: protein MOR1-like [Primulina eburnea]|uniref:LOW QUALITY PROTEIN: protein MOR1-like n=1 Tax=Primulina eburnea TaxID=1245227 RepID=UPI003C6CB222